MCSACLTPVYPMEKMVANKVILHYNCFCCKHCKKKLSIHNCSSLYGEFYCISHYQQLFKRKGNYDEGFGHMQHKDRWLQKNKGAGEPDATSTLKMTKTNLSASDGSKKSSADMFATKSSARELGCNSRADVKGKLKMNWPPEKKKTEVNPMQQTHVPALKNKTPDIGKAAMCFSENWKSESLNRRGEIGDKGVKEQSRTAGFISVGKLPSGKTNPTSDPIKADHFQVTTPPTVLHLPFSENNTNQKTAQTGVASASKTNYNSTSTFNKVRKSVRFAPNVDTAQFERSSQPSSGAKNEMPSDQSEESQVEKSKDAADISGNTNVDQVTSEFNKEHVKSEMYLEIPSYKYHIQTTNVLNQVPDGEVRSGQESPQTDITSVSEVVETVDESVGESVETQSLKTLVSAQNFKAQHEPPEKLDVIPRNPVSTCESENPSTPQSPAGHVTGEEVSLEKKENLFEHTDSTNNQEHSGNQKKPIARTNSLKGSAKQTEKSKVKLGSWSKGKSPLSKLFTSSGNDKTNKTVPKDAKKPDVKPSGGLLGRLFQSSSEKVENITTSAVHGDRDDETHADGENTEKGKDALTKDLQKEGDMSEVPPLEQDVGDHIKDESQCPEHNTLNSNCRSKEPLNHPQTSTSDLTAPAKTDKNPADDQEPNVQSSETAGLSVNDPEIESRDLPFAVQSANTVHEGSTNGFIPGRHSEEILSDPFNNDIFGVSSPLVGTLAIQIKTNESAENPNQLPDAPDREERNLRNGALFDVNLEHPQDSSNSFGLSDCQEISVNTQSNPFSSSLGDTALPAGASTESFSQIDSQPISNENEEILGTTDQLTVPDSTPENQDASATSDPFGTDKQTSEQNIDFDIFSSNNLFTQPPIVNVPDQGGADASTNQSFAFPDDIFGVSDVSSSADVLTVLPSGPPTSNSLNDLLGSDASSTAAPSAQIDLFTDDIFASEAQLLPLTEPSDATVFVDSLLVCENSNTGNKTENTSTNSSWMDDLLG